MWLACPCFVYFTHPRMHPVGLIRLRRCGCSAFAFVSARDCDGACISISTDLRIGDIGCTLRISCLCHGPRRKRKHCSTGQEENDSQSNCPRELAHWEIFSVSEVTLTLQVNPASQGERRALLKES